MENKVMEFEEMVEFDGRFSLFTAGVIKNDDGSVSIKVLDIVVGVRLYEVRRGWVHYDLKTINKYLKELGYSKEVGKDDFIPENLFYALGTKINNEVANEYQRWVIMNVIPQVKNSANKSDDMLTLSKALVIAERIIKEQKQTINNQREIIDNLENEN